MYRPANKPHFQRAYFSKELLRCNVVLKCKGRYAIGFQYLTHKIIFTVLLRNILHILIKKSLELIRTIYLFSLKMIYSNCVSVRHG